MECFMSSHIIQVFVVDEYETQLNQTWTTFFRFALPKSQYQIPAMTLYDVTESMTE